MGDVWGKLRHCAYGCGAVAASVRRRSKEVREADDISTGAIGDAAGDHPAGPLDSQNRNRRLAQERGRKNASRGRRTSGSPRCFKPLEPRLGVYSYPFGGRSSAGQAKGRVKPDPCRIEEGTEPGIGEIEAMKGVLDRKALGKTRPDALDRGALTLLHPLFERDRIGVIWRRLLGLGPDRGREGARGAVSPADGVTPFRVVERAYCRLFAHAADRAKFDLDRRA